MANALLVIGGFALGIGLERGWLPGVGMPFWIWLITGALMLTLGLALHAVHQ